MCVPYHACLVKEETTAALFRGRTTGMAVDGLCEHLPRDARLPLTGGGLAQKHGDCA